LKIKFYIVSFFIICIIPLVNGQEKPVISVGKNTSIDSVSLKIQKNNTVNDSLLFSDSLRIGANNDSTRVQDLEYNLSKDAIDDEIKYDARDSSWIDLKTEKIHLYGGAQIDYQKIKLNANYMVIDFANNIVEGFEKIDSTSIVSEKPKFADGDNTFTYREIKYNFKTKKGLVNHAISQQGEFNLVGSTTKFIGGATDSLGVKEDDRIYNKDAIITTCTHDPPHYGIRAGKLKFVPNKLAVMSVAQVEIAKVPTPIFLPFGFFPLAKGKSSGIIFPNYEYNEQLGLGFREIGYYWPVNDYMDLRVTGDIYTRGTHGIRINTNYKKKYGYTGNVTLGYANNIRDNVLDGDRDSQKSYIISIRHNQDAKAHPYRRMGGSVNIQSNRYDQRVFENPQAALTNTYSSNFSFSHDMPGTPFSFNAEFRHSQNTQTRTMDITLPNMTMRMNTIFPFKRKNSTKERWTDNIALSYNSEFRNFVKTTDTTLFSIQTLKDIQTGLQQRASVSTNFRVLKYFNVSPNINYDETWLLKRYKLTFDRDSVLLDTLNSDLLLFDTLGYKNPVASFESGFNAFRNMTTGVTVNTQIFGTIKGGRGFFRGIRHVMKPTIGFNYKPENKLKYEDVVDTDTRQDFNNPRTYSIFTNGPFGTLSGSEEQMGINYGITNVIEAKYYSKKDTIEKKVRLFDNISINGNYNFAADSFQWSNIGISGNTTVIKGLTNFNFRALYSPYVYDTKGKVTKETVWDKNRILPEFRNFGGQFNTGLSFAQIKEIFGGKKKDTNTQRNTNNSNSTTPSAQNNNTPNSEEETKQEIKDISLAEWFANFNISHSLNFEFNKNNGRDTFFVSNHSVNISGSVPLTKNWNMNIGNIAYDFKNKSFVYPYFSFARDLHCWQMNFTWAPVNGVYSFFIGVKSSALSFMKYDYGQRNADTLFTGRR
jgi:hypothetical protein